MVVSSLLWIVSAHLLVQVLILGGVLLSDSSLIACRSLSLSSVRCTILKAGNMSSICVAAEPRRALNEYCDVFRTPHKHCAASFL